MKKATKLGKSETSYANNPLQRALILMDESLRAWRQSLESPESGESQGHLDNFLVAAREGYRLTALMSGQTLDASEDIAQTCILGLAKGIQKGNRAPFVPSQIDALMGVGLKSKTKSVSSSSPLAGYLRGMLSNGVRKKVELMINRAMREGSADPESEIDIPSAEESGGDGFMGTNPDKIVMNVSAHQNYTLALRIQDEYLNSVTYKGTLLREVFGEWTPMGEWTGIYDKNDRPKDILKETLLLHVREIRKLILSEKKKTRPM